MKAQRDVSEVVDKFNAFGDDWQARINAVLRANA